MDSLNTIDDRAAAITPLLLQQPIVMDFAQEQQTTTAIHPRSSSKELETFSLEPIPVGVKYLFRIVRRKSRLQGTRYDCFLEGPGRYIRIFALCARKRMKNPRSIKYSLIRFQ